MNRGIENLKENDSIKELGEKALIDVCLQNLALYQLLTMFLTGFSEMDVSSDLLVQFSLFLDTRPQG